MKKQKKTILLLFLFLVPVSGVLLFSFSNTPTETVDAVVIVNARDSNFADSLSSRADVALQMRFSAINGFSASMSRITYDYLDSLPYIIISENHEIRMLEDTLDWGVNDIDSERVWGGYEGASSVEPGNVAGQGIKVCVADTGIDYNHPDLNDNYVTGYDFINNDNDPMDGHGHGTHCAGIIAAEDNGIGVIGNAPKASLYAAKVLSNSGSGTLESVAAGINWAVQNGMDVLSMSLGSSSGSNVLKQACDNAWDAGVLVVTASGNDYSSSISYPARYDSTMAIGATDSSHKRASFSNYGPQLDVVAPGVNVYSTVEGGGYQSMSGTSMATPMVAGVSALILSANPALTNDEVKDILHDTATDLGAYGRDDYYGYGLINAEDAVAAAGGGGGGDTTPPTVSISNPSQGSTISGTVSVSATANDNIGVTKVEFYIDNSLKKSDTSTPYTYQLDTTVYSDASHSIEVIAYDAAGNTDSDAHTIIVDNNGGGSGQPISRTFTGSVSAGNDGQMHSLSMPTNAESIQLSLEMPSGTDFDLSLWDNYGRRTGGWTSTDKSTSISIPGSSYSGYTKNPEWIEVDPIASFGTWQTSCYAYRGSGTYTITATIHTTGDTTPPNVDIVTPEDGATLDVSDVTVSWTGSDDESGIDHYSIKIDSGSWLDKGTSPVHTFTGLPDGQHSITVMAYDVAGNTNSDAITIEIDTSGGGGPITHMFTGSISQGDDSNQHTFNVPSGAVIEVSLTMPGGTDYDLSLWDSQNQRTGGWTSSDKSTKTQIPNSDYSGYSANPETISVDTSAISGTWKVGCYSYLGSGTYSITVNINGGGGGGGDIIPPTVSITSPASGSTVSGTTLVSATASDNVGVTKVEFYVDNSLEKSDANSPYNFNWDTTSYGDGSHDLKVIAYDTAGNTDIETHTVYVDNSGGGGGNGVQKYAVLVGISDYKAISDLSYCDEDVTDWYNFLTGSTMDFDTIWVYGDNHPNDFPKYDGKATEYNVKAALVNMVNLADEDDIIMFATSGHGSGDGTGYSHLNMWDSASGENGQDGNLYDNELANILDDAVAGKIHVFIDHCFSGGFGPNLMGMSNSQNVYCTTTCTDNGYGYDDPSHNNGAWTYYFLDYSWESHFGGSATTSLEDIFAFAHANYPHSGGDECEEYDGSSSPFYLN